MRRLLAVIVAGGLTIGACGPEVGPDTRYESVESLTARSGLTCEVDLVEVWAHCDTASGSIGFLVYESDEALEEAQERGSEAILNKVTHTVDLRGPNWVVYCGSEMAQWGSPVAFNNLEFCNHLKSVVGGVVVTEQAPWMSACDAIGDGATLYEALLFQMSSTVDIFTALNLAGTNVATDCPEYYQQFMTELQAEFPGAMPYVDFSAHARIMFATEPTSTTTQMATETTSTTILGGSDYWLTDDDMDDLIYFNGIACDWIHSGLDYALDQVVDYYALPVNDHQVEIEALTVLYLSLQELCPETTEIYFDQIDPDIELEVFEFGSGRLGYLIWPID